MSLRHASLSLSIYLCVSFRSGYMCMFSLASPCLALPYLCFTNGRAKAIRTGISDSSSSSSSSSNLYHYSLRLLRRFGCCTAFCSLHLSDGSFVRSFVRSLVRYFTAHTHTIRNNSSSSSFPRLRAMRNKQTTLTRNTDCKGKRKAQSRSLDYTQ